MFQPGRYAYTDVRGYRYNTPYRDYVLSLKNAPLEEREWAERYQSAPYFPVIADLPRPMAEDDRWEERYKELNDYLMFEEHWRLGLHCAKLVFYIDVFPLQMADNQSLLPVKSTVMNENYETIGLPAYRHAYCSNNSWALAPQYKEANNYLFCVLDYFTESHESHKFVEMHRQQKHGREAYSMIMAHYSALSVLSRHHAYMTCKYQRDDGTIEGRYAKSEAIWEIRCGPPVGWSAPMYGGPRKYNAWGAKKWRYTGGRDRNFHLWMQYSDTRKSFYEPIFLETAHLRAQEGNDRRLVRLEMEQLRNEIEQRDRAMAIVEQEEENKWKRKYDQQIIVDAVRHKASYRRRREDEVITSQNILRRSRAIKSQHARFPGLMNEEYIAMAAANNWEELIDE